MTETIKTAAEHMADAQAVAEEARRMRRNEFQLNSLHYTPPPWLTKEGMIFMEAWRNANIALHGPAEFAARFPDGRPPKLPRQMPSGMWLQAHDLAIDYDNPKITKAVFPRIILSLSGLNRYNAWTTPWISVAEHSVRAYVIATVCAKDVALYALVHDFHEAFVGDIVSPLQRHLMPKGSEAYERYSELLYKLDCQILAAVFDEAPDHLSVQHYFSRDVQASVRKIDLLTLEVERRACLPASPREDGWPVMAESEVAMAGAAWRAWCDARGLEHFGWGERSCDELDRIWAGYDLGAL